MARMRQACAQLSASVHCTYDVLVDLERATKFIEIQGDLELLDRLEKKLSFGRSKNSLKPRRSLLKLIRCLDIVLAAVLGRACDENKEEMW